MESIIKEIQSKINECIQNDFVLLRDSLYIKLHYLDDEQKKSFLYYELFRIADTLVQLRKNKTVDSLYEYLDDPDFLWNCTFIENLTSHEKKKYRNFNMSSFNLSQYSIQNSIYDESLPYFSKIIIFVVYSKYLNLLKNESKIYQISNPPNLKSSDSIFERAILKKTFESKLNNQQIEILTYCINDAKIFTEPISFEKASQIFKCELSKPLRVKNNRLLAYFFVSLDDRSFITHNWQSVCEANKLFLSSLKGNILKQTDLSTATGECRDFPPKNYEIIDKYIKQLKKH